MNNKLYIILALMVFMPLTIFAQDIAVKGKVLDNEGEPLIGATISEVGNVRNATITDADGDFSVKVKAKTAKLKISYIGYRDRIISPEDAQKGDIVLESDSQILGEVIMVGYGKQRAITSVGSTSQISSKELVQTPSASLQNALVGRLPGLFQQQTSGQPGADAANIYIRGQGTFANVDKSPLVMVDDIETSFATLSQLNAGEVENITILKDASSTAIFGVKGANGVILVTTKRGKEGATKVSYRMEYGIQKPTINNRTLGSYDSLILLKRYFEDLEKNPESELSGLLTPEALEHFRTGDSPYLYPDVNWYDATMRSSAIQSRHNVDVSGGVKDVKYFVSLGYLFQDGIMKEVNKSEDFNNNYYLRRYNIRSNVDIQATKDLKIILNIAGILDEKNEPYTPEVRVSGGTWPLFRRLGSGILPPYAFPVQNQDGSYGGDSGFGTNPLMLLEYGGYKRQFKNNINGNLSAEHKLDFVTKGLMIKGTMALTNSWGYNRTLTREEFPDYKYNKTTGELQRVKPDVNPLPVLVENANTTIAPYISPLRKITSQLILSYANAFGDHNVSGLGLITWDTYRSGGDDPQNFRGYSGRLAYDYKFRYMVEFNVGYNGSDRFKGHNKYGFFPAIAAGWNISEEPFLKDAFKKVRIDFLKFKASYGQVGSDAFDSSKQYIYLEKYERKTDANNSYYFGENPLQIGNVYPGSLGNDNVTWEVETKFDIGADLRLFDSKLRFEFDYFRNHRSAILVNRVTVPLIVGLTPPPVNLGQVINKGFELEGTWRDKIGQVNYFAKGNISVAKNTITEIDEASELYPLLKKTGRPVGQIFGYQWDGYYKDKEDIANHPDLLRGDKLRPGDLKYKDISGPNGVPDGVVDRYDIGPIGNPSVPQLTYGMSVGLNYKGFDFSVLFQGAAQGSIMSQQILQIGGINGRPREVHQGYWTEDRQDDATFPRLGGPNFDNSTFWLRPRDYIRLKNVEVGYNLPSKFVRKLQMSNLRIYANGFNLATWSNLGIYDVDPESNTGESAAYSSYPQMKVFNFGLQVTF